MESGDPRDSESVRPGVVDLLRLGGALVRTLVGPDDGRDSGRAACRWARELLEREGAASLEVPLPGHPVRIVGERGQSERILSGAPDDGGPAPGPLKEEAMSFLAPGALTVAHGRAWSRLRSFNERVLGTDGEHPFADTFLGVVRKAFAEPLRDLDDVRDRMGRAMVGIVLGRVEAGEDPAEDVRVLFDAVQSPLRRKLLGFLYTRRRDRLFDLLERVLDASDDGRRTLLARARDEAGELSRDEILQQVPHWMFTFTGSGSDLLGRTLALVAARPGIHRRVVREIRSAGPPDDPGTVSRLSLLEACLRESGRLFPPVTRTFHRGGGSDDEAELAHYFPLLQRDPELGPTVHSFDPERWRQPESDEPARASNLFLRGPRACPGEDLILFVCKTALARQLGEAGIGVRASALSRDPLPVSFPDAEIQFNHQEEA